MANIGQSPEPFLGAREDSHPEWFLGERTWIRATAAQTGGSLGVVEQVINPGSGSPYHVHQAEDESFYVIDGSVRFFSGAESRLLGPGGFAFLPRSIPHGFRVEGDTPARILVLVTPAGFEAFVAKVSESTPPSGPPDIDKLVRIAGQHGMVILGPLPE